MHRTFIIAEAGVNHNGDIEIAKKMIDVAAESGVDAIKSRHLKQQILFQRMQNKQIITKRIQERMNLSTIC